MRNLYALPLAAALLFACISADDTATTAADTGSADTAVADGGAPDTGPHQDAGVGDSASADGGAKPGTDADTGSDADVALTDVATPDTGNTDAAADATADAAADATEDTGPFIPPETDLVAAEGPANMTTAATGWYRGDLHYHTNYSGDAAKQGGDDLKTAIAIADAFRDPIYLAHNPENAGNGLDFLAVTDHRTDAALSDPDFHHDHLILLPGEEYGGDGHAGIWGLLAHISNDVAEGQTQNERNLEAVQEAHAQGALFSVNHPGQDGGWPWDTDGIDGMEVWNGPWGAFFGPMTVEDLDAKVASIGHESRYIRWAVESSGGGANDVALRMWYAHLTDGVHIPAVGGGDRHMIVPAGLPTTYVHRPDLPRFAGLEGKDLGWEGVVEGLRIGSTFVSRSPFGAQVVLEAEDDAGTVYPMGAELPGPGHYTIHVTITRAAKGTLRLITGPIKPGQMPHVVAEPTVLAESWIPTDRSEGAYDWEVPVGGAWLHAIVYEELLPEPLPPQLAPAWEALSKMPSGKDVASLAGAIAPILDPNILLNPKLCNPDEWDPWMLQCMPVDDTTIASFYVPDRLERLLNIVFEDGQPTDWTMGALTSAFMARDEPTP